MSKGGIRMKKIGIYSAFLVLIVIMCTACQHKGSTNVDKASTEVDGIELSPMKMIAVIKSMDIDNGLMTFINIDDGKEYQLHYNGGVDVRDKYDQVMAASLLKLGQLVDISYNSVSNKLVSIELDADAWEKTKVNKVSVNANTQEVITEDNRYIYSNDLLVFSEDKLVSADELCSEDEVTIRGYKGRICSIYVDYGHGYVTLADYDTYLGGMVEIGYDVIVPVTDTMLLAVREGDYKLRICKGDHVGYMNITVPKNDSITVSLKEIQIEPAKTGITSFNIQPADARVYIDGDLIDHTQEYETVYGFHRIKIFADGYTTYSSYIKVGEPYKIRDFALESGTTEEDSKSTTTETTNSSSSTTTGNKVTVTTPIGVTLYVDGQYIGETPASFTKTVGTHTITLAKAGYQTKSYTITLINSGIDDTLSYEELKSVISDNTEE